MTIPSIDQIQDPQQTDTVVALIYITMVVFIGQFILSTHNFVRFLVLQKRFMKVLPLSLFYILLILYQAYKVYYAYVVVQSVVEDSAFELIFAEYFSLTIGIAQLLVMVETQLRIQHDFKNQSKLMADQHSVASLNLTLKVYYAVFLTVITAVMLSGLIISIMLDTEGIQQKQKGITNMTYAAVAMFFVLAVLLTYQIYKLIKTLKEHLRFFGKNQNTFKKEICTLLTVLSVFDLSYILRIVLDSTVFIEFFGSPTEKNDYFDQVVYLLVTNFLYDCFPILFLQIHHYRNFSPSINRISDHSSVPISDKLSMEGDVQEDSLTSQMLELNVKQSDYLPPESPITIAKKSGTYPRLSKSLDTNTILTNRNRTSLNGSNQPSGESQFDSQGQIQDLFEEDKKRSQTQVDLSNLTFVGYSLESFNLGLISNKTAF